MRSLALFTLALTCALAMLACAGLTDSRAFPINAGTPSSVAFESPSLQTPGTLRVAVLSDRTTGWPEGLPILDQAVAEVSAAQPDFIITVGDMINGYTRYREDWMWEYENEWLPYVSRLGAPLYPAPGNHDVWPGTNEENDRTAEGWYQEKFGPLYYSYDVGRTHFVVLYSDEAMQWQPRMEDAQLNWLREDLRDLDADHLFVYMHRPLWLTDGSRWDEVHEMLAATGIARAVIAGHYHSYERSPDRDGIAYFILGCTGGSTEGSELAGGIQHWCLLTVEGDSWNLETKLIGGDWVPNDYVTSEVREARQQLWRLNEGQIGQREVLPLPVNVEQEDVPLPVRVTNPLDQDVTVRVFLEEGRESGWSMSPPEHMVTLASGASADLDLTLNYVPVETAGEIEPELDFTYLFHDSKGREVPITLERRLFWIPFIRLLEQRRARIEINGRRDPLEGWEGGFNQGLPTWVTASYENREGPAHVWTTYLADGHVNMFFRFKDTRIEDYPENNSPNVLSDGIILRSINASAEQIAIALFPQREGDRSALRVDPDRPEREWDTVAGVEMAARQHLAFPDIQLWELRVPLDVWLGSDWESREFLANIELLDNDGRYFTNVRSLTPTRAINTWPRLFVGTPPR